MAKLQLNRETLAELTADELASMGGGIVAPTPVLNTVPVSGCIKRLSLACPTQQGTCYCPPPQ